MRPSGQYRCVGCNLVFNSIDEWRTGIDSQGLSLSAFNGRPLLIDKEGNFKETLLLLPGYNNALFVAQDKFGRFKEQNLELVYIK